jgi:membrane fusion protein, multidrug efflux system
MKNTDHQSANSDHENLNTDHQSLARSQTVERSPSRADPKRRGTHEKKRSGRLVIFALVFGVGLIALLVSGLLPRLHDKAEQKETAKDIALGVNKVAVVRPKLAPREFEFSLPGSAEALTQATLYARINGYLKERMVDIGDHVKAGETLAVIDAPDIDAQLNQARAQLEQARAAVTIARLNYDREKYLLKTRVDSQQLYDEMKATFDEATANVKAAQAKVQNLTVEQGYEKITAPFTGVITARYVDVGALLAVGTSITTSPSLFTLQRTDILRIYIYVPQAYLASVQPGQEVDVLAPEYPNRVFKGKVTRIADALDPASRTERVEIQLPSANDTLRPGMYLTVHFHVKTAEPVFIVPATALDIRRDGPRVATVTPNYRIAFKKVTLGRDFGTTVEIVAGLGPHALLVANPSLDLVDGAVIDPVGS